MIRFSFTLISLILLWTNVSLAQKNTPLHSDNTSATYNNDFTTEIHPDAWKKPINQISQVACHNCYEPEIFELPLADALNYIKTIELDIWDEAFFLSGVSTPGYWYVRHGIPGTYSLTGIYGNHNNCSGEQSLSDCLQDINSWSDSNPGHFPITLFLDKKQSWSTLAEGRTPQDLFRLLKEHFGKKIYKPVELAERNSLERKTPSLWDWPTANELRGRIIVIITGGNFINNLMGFPFGSGNDTYNYDLKQVKFSDQEATAFSGPYVYYQEDFRKLLNWEVDHSAVFLNSNYNSAINTLRINMFNKFRTHNRLLRLWKVDDLTFCELLPLKVAYLAYYSFVNRTCHGYRIVPMNFIP